MPTLYSTNYKDALKYGFYELQTSRDWYREVTQDIGMHADLVMYWIRIASLLAAPIAPHFAEHIYSTTLKAPNSIQQALWPTPSEPVDPSVIESGQYMRGLIKTIRDAEVALVKMMSRTKGKSSSAPLFDPKKAKSVRIYVATAFPEWQDACVAIVKEAYSEEVNKVDDTRVKKLLTERGFIKDKRAMPFIQAFKVSSVLGWATRCSLNINAETNGPIWCPDSIPTDTTLLGKCGAEGNRPILQEIVEFSRCRSHRCGRCFEAYR